MIRKWKAGIFWTAISLFISFLPLQTSLALEQDEKLWTSLVMLHPLTADRQWQYIFTTTMRFVNNSHPWQTGFLEGGIGRQLYPGELLWAGYRWSAHNPNNGFYQTNTLWQQWIWDTRDGSSNKVLLRSRLEESVRGNQSQLSLRLRERFFVERPSNYFGFINPVFYEEVFFQLNKTNYTSHHLVSENRLFLGFNLLPSTANFWEVGYINQYLFATPLYRQNQMSHVVSVTYIMM